MQYAPSAGSNPTEHRHACMPDFPQAQESLNRRITCRDSAASSEASFWFLKLRSAEP